MALSCRSGVRMSEMQKANFVVFLSDKRGLRLFLFPVHMNMSGGDSLCSENTGHLITETTTLPVFLSTWSSSSVVWLTFWFPTSQRRCSWRSRGSTTWPRRLWLRTRYRPAHNKHNNVTGHFRFCSPMLFYIIRALTVTFYTGHFLLYCTSSLSWREPGLCFGFYLGSLCTVNSA